MMYKEDPKAFPAVAYSVKEYPGVAFYVLGWHSSRDWDDEAYEWQEAVSSDTIVARMVGDDRHHMVPLEDITPLTEEDYCPECGQIGCCHGR